MRRRLLLILILFCGISAAATEYDYVRVSRQDSRYFETTDSRTWVPVMMNYLVPDRDTSFCITEEYFRRFSENGGNALRIWISGGFLEIERGEEGNYSPESLVKIKKLLDLAAGYGIRVKFALTHIRTISGNCDRRNSWANRSNLASSYDSIDSYVGTERGRKSYLARAACLADKFSWSPAIWGWELWNEMNAAAWGNESWADFTVRMLPEIHTLFPRHTVTQTLGSLDRESADKSYRLLMDMQDADYIPIHRYLDEAGENYDAVKGPVDLLEYSAVAFALGRGKPILVNETGAVNPSHSGPSSLYARDSLGVLMHDMLFAPFFSGAAGCGAMWHWDSYVFKNNLWWQYARFCKSIEGIDPAEEHFSPSMVESEDVRFYSLSGKRNTLVWCRDARSDWRSELRDGIPAGVRKGVRMKIEGNPSYALIYDPWKDVSTVVLSPRRMLRLPNFQRSLVVRLVYGNSPGRNILLEAESFSRKGGWKIDQQFMDQMGSPYLIAHGFGKPVDAASMDCIVPESGIYSIYARTYNWTAPWSHSSKGAGSWSLSIDGRLNAELGETGQKWEWQSAGSVYLSAGLHTVYLNDLSGFDGRVDAIWISKDGIVPPEEVNQLEEFRRKYGGIVRREDKDASYDYVVVGAGIAGMCSAVAAARQGLKVALVGDRPCLGGNNSSEVRVHLGGGVAFGKYPLLGRMVREFVHSKKGNAAPPENYEDWKKAAFVAGEENVDVYLSTHVTSVRKEGDKIEYVVCRSIDSGEEFELSAPLFCDCSGDGNLGFLAGADWRMGREASDEYGESFAPPVADSLTMGASVQWYSVIRNENVPFPEFNYGVDFNDGNCEKVFMGEWTWETGMNRDQVLEAERIRDYGLMVIYSNWSFLKNHSRNREEYSNRELGWVSYVAGKRESRRLLGDYVISQRDFYENIRHSDDSFANTWSIDLHFPDPENSRKFPDEEFIASTIHRPVPSHAVPYRCLYSRNVANLFMAGRNISATHVALGTLRVMGTTAMMGEVTGLAASVASRHKSSPREVYEDWLDELVSLMSL